MSYRGGGRGTGRGTGRGGGRGGGRGDSMRGGSTRGGFGGGRPPVQKQVYRTPGPFPDPDASVKRAEDAIQAAVNLDRLNLKQNFPQRPGFGTQGKQVTLWGNYVQMLVDSKLVLYRYDIQVDPEAVGKKRVRIVKLLLEEPIFSALQGSLITDFKSTLLTRKRLTDDEMTYPITYRADGEDEPTERAKKYQVRVKYTNTLGLTSFLEHLTSPNLSDGYVDKQPMIQALNIFLNHYSKSADNLATIGASKSFSLSPDAAADSLGSGLQAIRGFFASVRAATARILVNVNVSYGAFYEPSRLDSAMSTYGTQNKYRLEAFLKRVKIKTLHLKARTNKAGKEVTRQKTIVAFASTRDGRSLAQPPQVTEFGTGPKGVRFWLESSPSPTKGGKGGKGSKGAKQATPIASGGEYITVFDFFKRAYNITLKQTHLPVVNVGTRDNPTYLPPEVCQVLPGQSARAKLDPGQTQHMIRFAVRKPFENATAIVQKGLSTAGLTASSNPLLARFGASINPSLITVPGRVLNSPKVLYRQKPARANAPGAWNAVGQTFTTGGAVDSWGWLFVAVPGFQNPFNRQEDFVSTLEQFIRALRSTGIQLPNPKAGKRIALASQEDPVLEAEISGASTALKMLFIVIPAANMPLYNRIKHLGDIKYGLATVCSVATKFASPRGQDQYFRNVALKFNLKLGGNNQTVEEPRLRLLKDDKTMVVGIDVTHPSPGSSSNAPSIAGMVANVDKLFGQWPAVLAVQDRARKEIVSDLTKMLKTRLSLWKSKGRHARLPENILVYRDGVSEGQYQLVLDNELPLLQQACKETYPPPEQKQGLPRITIVIVGKRHHTRFYPTSEENADNSSNCIPGTVVDRGITEARNWDFFLQAHGALQGTVRPGHYFVVHDEIFRSQPRGGPGNVADTLEDVTQSLCYLFGRATRAVSICTPAYYADLVCERARCYLSGLFEVPDGSVTSGDTGGMGAQSGDVQIHPKLRDTMFYI
ncbi:Piwi-domain-containing protein [Whalleya microplaca]|nr:Piwi-domain-containing protein [Whalleya microplaca]